jgi:uncharacterized protein (TIGR00255 family)
LPHSMTGFATAEALADSYKLVWEVRSVNHRYLDLGFRLPEDLRGLEPKLRTLTGEAVKRGKVDCTLKVSPIGGEDTTSAIDLDRVEALKQLENRILGAWPDARTLSTLEILRWPGVLKDDAGKREALTVPAVTSFEEAIESLRAAREREGQRLGEMLIERLDAIATLMESIDGQLAEAAPRYRDRLVERLARLDVEVNPERLEQELALIAQRTDVREEADRLRAHLSEIRDVLEQAEPIGRRLDFLIQELNREANTLASKVQDDELARRAVDLKVLIEQMREQAQNIE